MQYIGIENMPRPKVGDKRADILRAAIEQIAEDGVGASTASIAKAAGVAEGSLFRYFADKDSLLNEAYCEIKRQMRQPLTENFPVRSSLKQRAEHLWNAYVSWGATSPAKRRAMAQLTVSDRITERARKAGQEGLGAMSGTIAEVVAKGGLSGLPYSFAQALFLSIAEATIASMADDPKRREEYKSAGFQAFWNAATKK